MTATPARARDDLSAPPRLRAVVAEDDAPMRQLLLDALAELGFDAEGVRDGGALVAATGCDRNGAPSPADLLITDIAMPSVSGLEALSTLRSCGFHGPVIVITAFGSPAAHARARSLGASAVLDKPFDPAAFVAAVLQLFPVYAPGGTR